MAARSRGSGLPTYCNCGYRVVVGQCWTENNPGRKFLACPDYDSLTNTGGCKVFRWFDEGQTYWQKEVILRLKMENERLVAENNSLRTEISGLHQAERKRENETVMVKMGREGGIDMIVRGGFWTAVVAVCGVVLVKVVAR